MKFLKYIALFAAIILLITIVLFIFVPNAWVGVTGVLSGLALGGCFFTWMIMDSHNPFWDDEDFDEHKIYEE